MCTSVQAKEYILHQIMESQHPVVLFIPYQFVCMCGHVVTCVWGLGGMGSCLCVSVSLKSKKNNNFMLLGVCSCLFEGIDLQKSVTNLKACSLKLAQLEAKIVYLKNSF